MKDRIKPIIDSTYPALMAGLCLTFLAISPEILKDKILVFLVSTTSLLFIISSCSVFRYSLSVELGEIESSDNTNFSWKIGKWAFTYGLVFLLISTLVIIYILWFHDSLQSLLSYSTELFNSINVTETNNT
ncbi:hypothetical protein KAH94_06195 [bacterium]|nr:hypothetical protein [bacterium]